MSLFSAATKLGPLSKLNTPYSDIINTTAGNFVAQKLGLPRPIPLQRDPNHKVRAVISSGEGVFAGSIHTFLEQHNEQTGPGAGPIGGLIFDATSFTNLRETTQLFTAAHDVIPRLSPHGRIIIIGHDPLQLRGEAAIVHKSLTGFVRSLAKELRYGATANLITVNPAATQFPIIQSTVQFLLYPTSAFITGQIINLPGTTIPELNFSLAGKLAVVTGAARGIGLEISTLLNEQGAQVIMIDIPKNETVLTEHAARLGATPLALDITDAQASSIISDAAARAHQELDGSGIDILVNNAGITRDKLCANMTQEQWEQVILVNSITPINLVNSLVSQGKFSSSAAIINISSVTGIAGNKGQTNYALAKAALIGLVDDAAAELAAKGITINAIAPGFIETEMTAAIPPVKRELMRLMSTLEQGGIPRDVAQAVVFCALPASSSVTGNTIRVCGQNIVGA